MKLSRIPHSPPVAAPRLLLLFFLAGCTGTGPDRSLASYLEQQGLPADAPVVLVDLDDTVYERAVGRPMAGAAKALRQLAKNHLVVYLTARVTYAKLPGVSLNRSDSEEFLEENGFPDGPLFTSSLWNFVVRGQGGGKIESFGQLRSFGVDRVALAVGDRPHDLEAYVKNGHVITERVVIILVEDAESPDRDRADLPPELLERAIPGTGAAWPRIISRYLGGELESGGSWVVSQPPGS